MRSIARHRSRVALAIAAVLIIGALLAACGGGQPAPAPTQVAQAPAPTQAAATQPPPTQAPPTQAPPTNTAVPPTVTSCAHGDDCADPGADRDYGSDGHKSRHHDRTGRGRSDRR